MKPSPPENPHAELDQITAAWPDLQRLTRLVTGRWPEHAGYLCKSMQARSPGMMATSDRVARAVLILAGDHADQVTDDYRWLGDRIREEEMEFARTGRYRYNSFEQTNVHVYSDGAFMERYMHGLLFSHVLWYMHASSLHFFRQRLESRVKPDGRVLEVGSGHGLLLYLALADLGLAEAHGWDLSDISLAQTRAALALLGADQNTHFAIQDMHQVTPGDDPFDLVILSHILEHLDDPVLALEKMRGAVNRKGVLFVNVPLNAPMPDHIILLETPDQAADLLRRGGFNIVEMATHTTQGATLAQALKRKTAITCSIIAEPA
jgi:2-polyprenyl-3-methyl-5-hydroxy-6-metoxy-1,4-benzoquinol methylase